MTAPTLPQIACQRCGTTVPWGPYCPHCNAYLEFAGIPPWSPQPPVVDAPEAEPEQQADVSEPDGDASPAEVAQPDVVEAVEAPATIEEIPAESILEREPESEPVPEPVPEPMAPLTPVVEPPVKAESAMRRWWRGIRTMSGRQFVGYLAVAVVAVVLTGIFVLFSGSATAWAGLPFLLLWGLLAIGMFGTVPDVDEADAAAAEAARIEAEAQAARAAAAAEAARIAAQEEAARLAAEQAEEEPEVFRTLVGEDSASLDHMAARPPQPVERTAKVARPKTAASAVRDVACLTCGQRNESARRICEYCGASMEGAVVKPPVTPVLEARVLESEEQSARKRRRRNGSAVSRSWRGPIAAFTILAVIVGAFAFAFFGPGAFQLRFGTMRVYQLVARWVNPYVGEAASVESVTATSSLAGADPMAIAGADARTFWASAPAPGYGTGTVITYSFPKPVEIDRMVIFPGIQSGQFDIRALATPRKVTLSFDDGTTVTDSLAEIQSSQQQRQLVTFRPVTTGKVKLTIDSVYPPRGDSADAIGSVAISGTEFLEVPPTPTFFGFQNGTTGPRFPGAGS